MGEQWGKEDESHASLTISAQPYLYALNQILAWIDLLDCLLLRSGFRS